MKGSIICGVDNSDSAKGAARVARRLSADLRLPLLFVSVVDDDSSDGALSSIAERLHDLTENVADVDCGAHWVVEVGHPADRLVAVAEKEAARLLVVGSTGPRSSLLGSISADVSRRAPCPVVVVAPGADQPVTSADSDGHTAAIGFDAAWQDRPANGDGPTHDIAAHDFAGGIVRFGVDAKR
jgi:nucleotide-binding universal stress UspA family protein